MDTNRDGFEFDLVTQRFLRNRWDTKIGEVVCKELVEGIKSNVEIRAILDPYVLQHPENQDPYAHPFYPKDAMDDEIFWVLTQDDLRGISFYNEDLSKKLSIGKKDLSYARFFNCSFKDSNLQRTSLTQTLFEKCNLQNIIFAGSGGYGTKFIECNLVDACLWSSTFIETDFSNSDLSGAYFESTEFIDIKVNYLTVFDRNLNNVWSDRKMPDLQKPEMLKSIKLAYEKSELWPIVDQYLFLERKMNRKAILWPHIKKNKSISSILNWFVDWLWGITTGYGVKPGWILLIGLLVALLFSIFYFIVGNPGNDQQFVTSLYYSLTTFATLGYGDLSYKATEWFMRLMSTVEALSGAVVIAVFVSVLARKVIRH